jgi:hypothetical protein
MWQAWRRKIPTGFWREKEDERDHVGDQVLDGKIILKLI